MFCLLKNVLVVVLICWGAAPLFGVPKTPTEAEPNRISVSELLEKYAEAHNKLKSFSLEYDDEYQASSKLTFLAGREKPKLTSGGYFGEIRSDGNRHYICERLWGRDIGGQPRSKASAKSDPRYNADLWDGEKRFQYQHSNAGPANDKLFLISKEHDQIKGTLVNISRIHNLWGFFDDTYNHLPYSWIGSELRQTEAVVVQEKMEELAGSKCYVINANTKNSKYKLWIDPNHGYNIARAEIFRGGEGLKWGKPEEVSLFTYLKDVRFERFDNVWVLVEADCGYDRKLTNDGFEKEDHHIKITKFVLRPDHERLGSFRTDYIKNGTTTYVIGVTGTYTWQDGKVVDENGRVIIDCRPKKPAKK